MLIKHNDYINNKNKIYMIANKNSESDKQLLFLSTHNNTNYFWKNYFPPIKQLLNTFLHEKPKYLTHNALKYILHKTRNYKLISGYLFSKRNTKTHYNIDVVITLLEKIQSAHQECDVNWVIHISKRGIIIPPYLYDYYKWIKYQRVFRRYGGYIDIDFGWTNTINSTKTHKDHINKVNLQKITEENYIKISLFNIYFFFLSQYSNNKILLFD
jgi:hypothetical protein